MKDFNQKWKQAPLTLKLNRTFPSFFLVNFTGESDSEEIDIINEDDKRLEDEYNMQDMEYNVSLPSATVLQLEAAKPPSLIHTESSFTGCILKIENSQKIL